MVTKHIDGFYFDNAVYFIIDKEGNSLYLNIDYKRNRFRLTNVVKKGIRISELRNEAGKIARDLLERKSGVNFVERVQ